MKARKKALLITYYWPPSGGAGVHRWLRFSSFFDENEVDLTVYCPSDAAWPVIDKELEQQISSKLTIIRRPIFEPHRLLGNKNQPGVGLSEQIKRSVIKKMIVWVRGNLFIPDSRTFWIKPSVRFLNRYLSKNSDFDTIISTGPPHSVHLIAMELKKKHSVKWIADFRDPWTQIDFYEDLNIGKRADRIQRELEKTVLTTADEIVTVSQACADGLTLISGRPTHVITNGYTFPEFDLPQHDPRAPFTLAHFGSLPASRNPVYLWEALHELIEEKPEFAGRFQLQLIGTVDIAVQNAIHANKLDPFTSYLPPIPHHESIEQQRRTALLLLIANSTGNVKGILTGKFFEYLGAKRPILALGEKESDLQNAMNETNAGFFGSFETKQLLKEFILLSFEKHCAGKLESKARNLDRYSSSKLASDFCKLI